MLNWLKNLLLGFDRTEAASARAAKAMEDIATDLEAARDGLRHRLGIEAGDLPRPAKLEATDEAEPEVRKNGRRKATV